MTVISRIQVKSAYYCLFPYRSEGVLWIGMALVLRTLRFILRKPLNLLCSVKPFQIVGYPTHKHAT